MKLVLASLLAYAYSTWLMMTHPIRKKSGPFDAKQVKKILVVRTDKIGDVVMTSAFFRELARAYPEAKIDAVVTSVTRSLVEHCPYVHRVMVFPHEIVSITHSPKAAVQFAKEHLIHENYDLAISPRFESDVYQSSYLVYASRARWRLGYSESISPDKSRINKGFDRLLTHCVTTTVIDHEIRRNLHILQAIGITPKSEDLELWLSPESAVSADTLLGELKNGDPNHLIVLGLGAAEAKRIWPVERFVEIARWIREKSGCPVVMLGTKAEIKNSECLNDFHCEGVLNLLDRTTLQEAAQIVKKCFLYIGNDTGLMHIAAASKAAVVEISCHPQSGSKMAANAPERVGPWVKHCRVLQPSEPDAPCIESCEASEAHCIQMIEIQDVKDAILDLMPSECINK